jgi:hypothetical protein
VGPLTTAEECGQRGQRSPERRETLGAVFVLTGLSLTDIGSQHNHFRESNLTGCERELYGAQHFRYPLPLAETCSTQLGRYIRSAPS